MTSIRSKALMGLLAVPAMSLSAQAATLCVSAGVAPGCYTTISDAVSAASVGDVINVGPGTYKESVTVTKPISLVGDRATIDATGLSRGVFVDGLNHPGLGMVHISGFTLQNANFEGVLVLNASAVTVSANTVLNNNKAATGTTCPGIEAFEPGEAQDCGEGIHLQGADHSIVTNNMITGNAGVILMSDDSGTTHDNLVSFNTVKDNPLACGITMASHVTAPNTGTSIPLGVFHNTVYGNRVSRNGNAAGGGAGVGIFASVPGAKTYANVVVNNFLTDNGHAGVSFHAHAPGQLLNDNMIVGNTIANNGADTADAATPATTGVNVYSLMPVTGNIISGNEVQNEAYDVVVNNPAFVQVEFNSLLGTGAGVDNLGSGSVDATNNWWGCTNGPTLAGSCTSVAGSAVAWMPWLKVPPPGQPVF